MGHEQEIQPSPTMNNCNSLTKRRTFTMVYLDLDDTLIPTTIRNSLRRNYGFDLFNFINTQKLQSDIINCIKKIKKSIQKNITNHDVKFVVVSAASKLWIHDMIMSKKNAKFPTLAKYFADNEILILASEESAYIYLCNKFSAIEAKNIISHKFNGINRFMYKYTTFGMKMREYETKYNLKCSEIISIGDGFDEHQSIKLFTERNKDIVGVNIRFKKAPTIKQLESEWNFVGVCFDGCMKHIHCTNNKRTNYFEINIDERFKNDNNILCTGKYQLNAISLYFNAFMKMLCKSTKETKKSAIKAVCKIVHENSRQHAKSSPRAIQLKEMFRIAVRNEEFNKSISEMMIHNKSVYIR